MNDPSVRNIVFDTLLAQMIVKGMTREEILQWAEDNCPCEKCRNKRNTKSDRKDVK